MRKLITGAVTSGGAVSPSWKPCIRGEVVPKGVRRWDQWSSDELNKRHGEDDLLKRVETTGCFSIFKHFKIILYGLRHTETSAFLFLLFSTLWQTKWASVGAGVAGYVQGVGYTSSWWPSLLLTAATYVHAQLRWWKHILLMSSHVCVVSFLPLSAAATAERPPRANTSARCQCHAWTQSSISRVALTGPVVWKYHSLIVNMVLL